MGVTEIVVDLMIQLTMLCEKCLITNQRKTISLDAQNQILKTRKKKDEDEILV